LAPSYTPLAGSAKKALDMSGTSKPMVLVFFVTKPVARAFGVKL